MYESWFQFSHRPFAPAPQVERYIPTGSLEHARQTLVRCVERAEGPGLVVGPSGSGKSLLCQVLAQHFRSRFLVALLSSARLSTRRALLQNILFELKLPYREMDESELRLSLIDHLEPRTGGGDGLLLIVDEAHTLPLRLLEEVRLLTNLVKGGQSRVSLVLAGNMSFEERLASPKLDSFHQRIAARCYLQPFSRDETLYYVQEQIRRVGGQPEAVFTAEAQRAIHTATDGIPRLVNQLCDHALLLGSLGGHKQLGPAGIEEAWADLQQLPVPWSQPPLPASVSEGIIEFGQLGDAPEKLAAAIDRDELGSSAIERIDQIGQGLDSLQTGKPTIAFPVEISDDDLFPAPSASDSEIQSLDAFDPDRGSFSPAAENGTEVELIFHEAHDPFGSHWDEEEVVIDRYASLENASLRSRQHVSSDEGRAIAAAVASAMGRSPPDQSPADALRLAAGDREYADIRASHRDEPATIAAAATFNPACDPVLPEEPANVLPPSRRATISLRAIAEDDRDMIHVEDEDPRRPPTPPKSPRRPEYRQLFSTLRSKG